MHRWLSVYNVILSNLQIFDALILFYYGFLNDKDRLIYLSACINIYKQRNVGTEGKREIKEIWHYLRKKNLTNDGRKRKERIISKLFYCKRKLQLIMHFYASVFPLFKRLNNILDKECGRMNIETLSSILTVQYKLRKSEKSAIEFFKRDDYLHSPVQKSLCNNLQSSYRLYKNELDVIKKERGAKKENLKAVQDTEMSKKKSSGFYKSC